jgi:hypothetical protein
MGNDHAETILQALHLLGPDPVDDDAELHEGQLHGYEALRLLVAERDLLAERCEMYRSAYRDCRDSNIRLAASLREARRLPTGGAS